MKTTLNTSFVTSAMKTEALLAHTSAVLYEADQLKKCMADLRMYTLILMNTAEYESGGRYERGLQFAELVCLVSQGIQFIEQSLDDGDDMATLFETAQTLYEDVSELNELVGGE